MPNPLRWYVDWVRGNQENAASLERLTRTFSLVLSDPHNLINMEAFYTLAKVHSFTDQAIINTAGRRVPVSEAIALMQRAVQEVECLGELMLRKYCGHEVTWNAMLALEVVKCVLNVCVHRQLFLVPWLWDAMRRSLRRSLRGLAQRSGRTQGGNMLVGSVTGPNGARLVIPRVVSSRRHLHRHSFSSGAGDDGGAKGDVAGGDDEGVPFTWVDLLGLLVDAYMLARPVLLVAAARHVFPRGAEAASIASLSNGAAPTVKQEDQSTAGARDKAEATALESYSIVRATIAASPARTLMGSRKVWITFALADFLTTVLARFIRRFRVPVVYINDDVRGATPVEAASAEAGVVSTEVVRSAAESAADGEPAGEEASSHIEPVDVPAVVSRDCLRLQQALRSLAYNFLRDPFFSAVLKSFIFDHFVAGRINRIPLIGSLIGFQVSYFLAMQHYSFLYSTGQ